MRRSRRRFRRTNLNADAKRTVTGAVARDPRFADYHAPADTALIQAIERDHGITADRVATQGMIMFSAFLDTEQLAAVEADGRVMAVEKNRRASSMSTSRAPRWPRRTSLAASPCFGRPSPA